MVFQKLVFSWRWLAEDWIKWRNSSPTLPIRVSKMQHILSILNAGKPDDIRHIRSDSVRRLYEALNNFLNEQRWAALIQNTPYKLVDQVGAQGSHHAFWSCVELSLDQVKICTESCRFRLNKKSGFVSVGLIRSQEVSLDAGNRLRTCRFKILKMRVVFQFLRLFVATLSSLWMFFFLLFYCFLSLF